jgi:hypothetical protein
MYGAIFCCYVRESSNIWRVEVRDVAKHLTFIVQDSLLLWVGFSPPTYKKKDIWKY